MLQSAVLANARIKSMISLTKLKLPMEIMITRSGFAHCCIVVQLPDAYWGDAATGRCISQRDAKKSQAFFSSRIHYDAFLVVRVFPDVFHFFEAQYSIGRAVVFWSC